MSPGRNRSRICDISWRVSTPPMWHITFMPSPACSQAAIARLSGSSPCLAMMLSDMRCELGQAAGPSTPIARVAAGAFGFLTFIHVLDGPDRYGAFSFFEIIPSRPSLQIASTYLDVAFVELL